MSTPSRRLCLYCFLLVMASGLSGCAVVSTTASVVGTTVSTAVSVTGSAVRIGADAASAGVHAVTSSSDDSNGAN
jgi:phosphate/sulfate permease